MLPWSNINSRRLYYYYIINKMQWNDPLKTISLGIFFQCLLESMPRTKHETLKMEMYYWRIMFCALFQKKATDEASYQTLNYANMDMINEIFVQYVYTLMIPQLHRLAAILLYFVSKIWRWLHCKSDSYEVHKT